MQSGIQLMLTIFVAGIVYVTFRGMAVHRSGRQSRLIMLYSLWEDYTVYEVGAGLVFLIVLYYVLRWLANDNKKFDLYSLLKNNTEEIYSFLLTVTNFINSLTIPEIVLFFMIKIFDNYMTNRVGMIPLAFKLPSPIQFTKIVTFSYILFFLSIFFMVNINSIGTVLVINCLRTIASQFNVIIDGEDHGNSDRAVNASQYISLAANILVALYFIIRCIFELVGTKLFSDDGISDFSLMPIFLSVNGIYQELSAYIRMRQITNQLDSLPSIKPEEDDVCIICRLGYEGEEAKRLPCGHTFHANCLERWVKSHNRCPICEQEIKFDGTMVNMYETQTHNPDDENHDHEENQNNNPGNNEFGEEFHDHDHEDNMIHNEFNNNNDFQQQEIFNNVPNNHFDQNDNRMQGEVDFRQYDDDRVEEEDPNTFNFADFNDGN